MSCSQNHVAARSTSSFRATWPTKQAMSIQCNSPSTQEASSTQVQWPSGRAPIGFLTSKLKSNSKNEDACLKSDAISAKKKSLTFSSSFGSHTRHQVIDSRRSSARKLLRTGKDSSETCISENPSESSVKPNSETRPQFKTPITLPSKRKLAWFKGYTNVIIIWLSLRVGMTGKRLLISPWKHIRKLPFLQRPSYLPLILSGWVWLWTSLSSIMKSWTLLKGAVTVPSKHLM